MSLQVFVSRLFLMHQQECQDEPDRSMLGTACSNVVTLKKVSESLRAKEDKIRY